MIEKPRDRSWFDRGGKHRLDNRIDDFRQAIESVDVKGMSAVDIGAAEGDITEWLLERFDNVHAIEYMDDAYNKLKKKLVGVSNVTIEQSDISNFPLQESYHVVFLLGVLHYFESEAIRKKILQHCLNHTQFLCVVRAPLYEFRLRDNRRLDRKNRYLSIDTLNEVAGKDFSVCIIDNGYRGVSESRLGDLIVFRSEVEMNPLPALESMFGAVNGYSPSLRK